MGGDDEGTRLAGMRTILAHRARNHPDAPAHAHAIAVARRNPISRNLPPVNTRLGHPRIAQGHGLIFRQVTPATGNHDITEQHCMVVNLLSRHFDEQRFLRGLWCQLVEAIRLVGCVDGPHIVQRGMVNPAGQIHAALRTVRALLVGLLAALVVLRVHRDVPLAATDVLRVVVAVLRAAIAVLLAVLAVLLAALAVLLAAIAVLSVALAVRLASAVVIAARALLELRL